MLLDKQEKLYERQSVLKDLLEACQVSECSLNGAGPSAVEDWAGEFEWDARADDVKLNVFGISTYRANQRQVGIFSLTSLCFISW